MRIKLYDPMTKGTLYVGSISAWKRTSEFSSAWVDDDQTKLYLCADVSVTNTDTLFVDPLKTKAFMLKENDDLKDFVRIVFSDPFVEGSGVKSCELMYLVPISNIEYCQLTLKQEKKSGRKRDLHKQTAIEKVG